jgi:hypothetical protein
MIGVLTIENFTFVRFATLWRVLHNIQCSLTFLKKFMDSIMPLKSSPWSSHHRDDQLTVDYELML